MGGTLTTMREQIAMLKEAALRTEGAGFIQQMIAAETRMGFLRRRCQIGPGVKSTRYRTGGRYPGHVLRKLRAERGVGRPQ